MANLPFVPGDLGVRRRKLISHERHEDARLLFFGTMTLQNGFLVMKRLIRASLFVAVGVAIGVPVGFLVADRNGDTAPAAGNPNSMNITLPRDYFAQLPESPDGHHRLVTVDTFIYTGAGGPGMEPGDELVLPRFDFAEMSDAYRERFLQLQR